MCEWTKPENGATLATLYADLTKRIDAALTPAKWQRLEVPQPKSIRFEKEWIVLGQVIITVVPPSGRELSVKVVVECDSRH